MKTRDRILDATLGLFNERGTAAVSTNHIAEALGISPGNLYYHFRNKEEIVRALFERLFAAWDTLFAPPVGRPPQLADLRRLVRANFELLAQYRFVYRELVALLRRDEALRARWLEVRARGFRGFHELFQWFVAAGVLRQPEDEHGVARLAELCWLVTEFWLPSVEVSGAALDDARLTHGVTLMMQVLQPYVVAPDV
jgi:AcrR family transcriptional regulator